MKRLVAQELTLSFVPEVEQRLWRTVTRRKYQLTCNRVQLQNRLECLLEEAHIKCRAWCRICSARAPAGCCRRSPTAKPDPAAVAALASQRLRATPEQLCDALGACTDLHPVYRRLLQMALDELRLIEDADSSTRSGTRAVCSAPSGCRAATGGRAGLGRRFGAADHRRGRTDGRDISVRQTPRVVGGRVSGSR